MIPQINISDFKGFKVMKDRRSSFIMVDGEMIGIFIKPQTDFIKQSAMVLAERSNSVFSPENWRVPEPEEEIHDSSIPEDTYSPPEEETGSPPDIGNGNDITLAGNTSGILQEA